MKLLTLALLTTASLAQDVPVGATWSLSDAEISREFSNYAYCGQKIYSVLTYEGQVKGFQHSMTLYNKGEDVEGFIGYLPSNNSIYVVFKGSTSIKNWITNLDGTKAKYKTWSDCNCSVHAGF